MPPKPVVFIHTNAQQFVGAKVAEHALRKHSRNLDKFEIRILHLDDYPHLKRREGQTYLRKGTVVTWRNEDLQSFSPLRFLPPQELGYRGRALVIDPDIFALADVWELLNRDMEGKAIWCRQVARPDGSTWFATSCMLLDCAKLRHWDWDRRIDEMFAHQCDYGSWIFLKTEDPATIGPLEEEWNHFDTLTERTRLLHCTERSTQPWKTGLPVDFNLNYRADAVPRGLRYVPRPILNWSRALLGRGESPAAAGHQRYQPHPDPRQERYFFSLVKECLREGTLTHRMLKEEMRANHIRHDTLALLEAA
jgi:hypothetical protein